MKSFIKHIRHIPLSIWAIGVSTFLLNASSVIVFGLCALYLKDVLGASMATIAAFQGAIEATSNFMKVFSGILSDYLRRRKNLMILGFTFAMIARPIMAIFPALEAVFIARFMDRIGNGLQSAPRDALVGDLAPSDIKGACYGLRQTLSTAGSLGGGALSFLVMTLSNNDYTLTFWVASIPAALALIILLCFVKEPKQTEDTASASKPVQNRRPIRFKDIKSLGGVYWLLMIIAFVFFLGRISESFLLLNANTKFSMDAASVQLIIMLYNGSNSFASFPIGMLSDRVKRVYILLMGFVLFITSDLILSFSDSQYMMFFAVILWGIQIGVTQSMFLTFIADTVPKELRGTGIGVFYLMTSISLIFGAQVAGYLADHYGLSSTFLASAAVASVSFIGLLIFAVKNRRPVEIIGA